MILSNEQREEAKEIIVGLGEAERLTEYDLADCVDDELMTQLDKALKGISGAINFLTGLTNEQSNEGCNYLSHDDFDGKYTQDETIKSEEFDDDGRLETYGPDRKTAYDVEAKFPRKVWSCVDGENGIDFVTGLRSEAIYFIITLEEWADENEIYSLELGQD